jgi:hypothetical protein
MTRFIIIRLIQAALTLVLISMVVFALARASGDPVMLMAPAQASLEDIEALRQYLGLDKSIPEQYWIFLKNVAKGDLGESIRTRRPVATIIGERLPYTILLGLSAIVIGVATSLILGVTAACNRGRWIDSLVKFIAILGQALPSFWVAIVAIQIFAVYGLRQAGPDKRSSRDLGGLEACIAKRDNTPADRGRHHLCHDCHRRGNHRNSVLLAGNRAVNSRGRDCSRFSGDPGGGVTRSRRGTRGEPCSGHFIRICRSTYQVLVSNSGEVWKEKASGKR